MTASKPSTIESFCLRDAIVQVRCLDADEELHRLYRYPGGDFHPAPPQYRMGRLDPPPGRSEEFGMLYAADSLHTAALECGALLLMPTSPPTFARSEFAAVDMPPFRHVVLKVRQRVRLLDFTNAATAMAFGLNTASLLDQLGAWRDAAASAVRALEEADADMQICGICYRSRRNPAASNYALLDGRYQRVFKTQEMEAPAWN
ncbi:RES family NAD+ phosphorylase [Hydrogenophaga laconesensis]|jgi:hypothetical protein|uniref:RES domain-containing protein n=1 Tax=Hydrogenophaga laconesensis TaxID=1805971 RepID=A0ABU1V916_9BURK|nr:RES domain-containing protein [Hydrogenophaga laconesensis]MDR7093951.1 hypothetical protein [Hydrogenophaga laconesensis]